MKTKIATTFGLALMLVLGIFGTMLALGMFNSAPPVYASDVSAAVVVVDPDKARDIGQYTITVTSSTLLAVGQRVFVTFPSGVPSSISTSNVKIKANLITDPTGGSDFGTENEQQDAGAISISGDEVGITVPDMNRGTNTGTGPENAGDNGIRAGALITLTFLQAANIQNPNTAKTDYTVDVRTDTDTTDVPSSIFTITSELTNSDDSGARGDTITTSGVGMNKNAANVTIYLIDETNLSDAEDEVVPTVTSATVIEVGSGSIDSDGVFTGTWSVDDSTTAGGFIRIVDSAATPVAYHVSDRWTQDAGATPQGTPNAAGNVEKSPGAKVKVDLVDFTNDSEMSTTTSASIGDVDQTSIAITLEDDGSTLSDTPYEFTVASDTNLGTHTITITDGSSKTATFQLDIVSGTKTLTVTPNPASIGQSITIQGTGFGENEFIPVGNLTAAGFPINTSVITVDSVGDWSFVTVLSTDGTTTSAPASKDTDSITIKAVEEDAASGGNPTGIEGESSGFARTARTITADPTEAAPGASVSLSGTGMTVDTNEFVDNLDATITASVTITLDTGTLTGNVFPIASDGSWSGIITLPIDAGAGTLTVTATDNALALNTNTGLGSTAGRTAEVDVEVPSGTVTVSPASASTGELVTVSGVNFPPNRSATSLTIGSSSAIPAGGIQTGSDGNFSALIEVPAAVSGGSLTPGVKLITVAIGQITGSTTAFAVPNPTITLTPDSAVVGAQVDIVGTGFDALTSVSVLTIGIADVNPSPAPRATRTGGITATIVIPALNPGTYTVVMNTGSAFAATATFTALASEVVVVTPAPTEGTPTDVFSEVITADPDLQVWSFSGQQWRFFGASLPASLSDLAEVQAGDGVWLFNSTDADISVTVLERPVTLVPGWNLKGL